MSRRATVQEQISSPFMDSPPPHLDAPFFGADLIPSGRLRRMRGYRYSPGGLEEEVRHTIALHADRRLHSASRRLALAYTHQPHPFHALPTLAVGGEVQGCRLRQLVAKFRVVKRVVISHVSACDACVVTGCTLFGNSPGRMGESWKWLTCSFRALNVT
jgi:hypothetical protein